MTRKLYLGMVALMALAAVSTARAEKIEPVEVEQVSTMNVSTQFASMQAELERLRSQQAETEAMLARFEQVSFGGGGCDDCGKGKCDDCGASCGCNCFCNIGGGGVYGGAEAVIVRPHFSHEIDVLGGALDNGQPEPFDPRFDVAVSPRIFVGWRNCRGTGIRARYWYFDQEAELHNYEGFEATSDKLVSGLDVQALDLEFTQLVCWGPVRSNFAFGVRYGSVENDWRDFSEVKNTYRLERKLRTVFDGWGPTIAMENRIPLGCSNLAVVGNLRGALLFGDTHYTAWGDFDFFEDEVAEAGNGYGNEQTVSEGRDDVVAVAELQVGLEWQRYTRFGVLSAYGLFEGQYWAGATGNLGLDALIFPVGGLFRGFSTNEDLGFVGATAGIQLAR